MGQGLVPSAADLFLFSRSQPPPLPHSRTDLGARSTPWCQVAAGGSTSSDGSVRHRSGTGTLSSLSSSSHPTPPPTPPPTTARARAGCQPFDVLFKLSRVFN
uniref:Uncharacterized protein n=1 Tax=Anopheles farauti TaxID=69004 RepID=A0A182QP01_9DIPT